MPPTRRSSGVVHKPTARQGIPKDVLVELNLRHKKACMFCGRKEISEKLYGPLYQLNDVIVHYFCILLSSRAAQKGSDKEGIWGFLLKDIKAEITRGSRETCTHCKKMGATISCCANNCRKIFHLPCGLENGSMHQYFQTFKSFCKNHRVIQTVDLAELQKNEEVQCSICKEHVFPYPSPSSLWAPCCKRNAWFHRDCIQDLALSAGYFFKCPLCNNVELFKSRMLTLGIYIPSRKHCYLKKLNHRDASWETVPNAYAELLERPSTCTAENCLCPHHNRRNFQQDNGSWEIILCHTCGSSGTHKLCSSVKCGQNWFCMTCTKISESNCSKRRRIEPTNTVSSNGISTPDEEELPLPRNNSRRTPREVSRNRATRESERLNNNKESTKPTPSQPISTPQQISDTILISDDSSDDSDDVQCLTAYIDPPRMVLTSQYQSRQMPVIQSYTSMNNGNSPIINVTNNQVFRPLRRRSNYIGSPNTTAATATATTATASTSATTIDSIIDLTGQDDDE